MNRALSPVPIALPVLALTLNAFVWGVSWWPFRTLQGLGLHPLWATVLIYAAAVLAIAAWRPRALREALAVPALWVLVLAAGTTNAAFNWAVAIGDVVRVVLLFYLMPLWAVVLARLVLGERLTALSVARVVLALTGAAFVLKPEGQGLPLPQGLPDGLALLGGFSFALNNVMLRREGHRPQEQRAVAMFVGGVLVAGLVAALLAGSGRAAWPPLPQTAWLLPAAMLAAAFLLSNLALQYGAARLPANVTAVVMLVEVVFASVSAVVLGAAEPTLASAVGGALILTAAGLSWLERAPR